MTDDITNYNLVNSLKRMDRILDSNPRDKFEEKKSIPAESAMTFENGCYVDCVALSVDIRDSSQMPNHHTRPVLAKIYRAYLSEISALMESCKLKRHTRIVGDAVLGIFNAPRPEKHVREVFLVGARISNVIEMLNEKLEKKNYKPIQVGIGISYGRALMVKAGFSSSGVNDIVWMGDVVNKASKIGNRGNKPGNKEYMVCDSVYRLLPECDQDFLDWNQAESCFHANINHAPTSKKYDRIKKNRAAAKSKPAALYPLYTTSTPPVSSTIKDTQPPFLGGLGTGLTPSSSAKTLLGSGTNKDKQPSLVGLGSLLYPKS